MLHVTVFIKYAALALIIVGRTLGQHSRNMSRDAERGTNVADDYKR